MQKGTSILVCVCVSPIPRPVRSGPRTANLLIAIAINYSTPSARNFPPLHDALKCTLLRCNYVQWSVQQLAVCSAAAATTHKVAGGQRARKKPTPQQRTTKTFSHFRRACGSSRSCNSSSTKGENFVPRVVRAKFIGKLHPRVQLQTLCVHIDDDVDDESLLCAQQSRFPSK